MIKLKDLLNEIMEMASTDIHYQNILNAFINSDNNTKKKIAQYVSGQGHMDQAKLEYDLLHLDYEDVIEIENALDLNPLEEKKKKSKVNPAYLTKDAAAMKKEINRVKKLKSDDPSAYGKWEADYADKDKTKKYKTKKSAATSAYEKRFGKKEK
jgi:hypothetical protein